MAFAALLRELGAPVDRYLRQSGLPVLCDDPSARVPLTRAWSFFETAARREEQMLGWLVGAYIGDRGLATDLKQRIETAPTLLRALQHLARFVRSEVSETKFGILERSNDVLFYNRVPRLRQARGYPVAQAYRLGVTLDLVRHYLGPDWAPTEIGVESQDVPSVLEERYPDSRIRPQQRAGYIAIPKSCLHLSAHTTVASEAGRDAQIKTDTLGYVDTVRAVLRSYLSEGYPSEQFAAELMGTSVRTLTRRLSAEGLTYGKLIDDLRFQVAKQYLENPDMRVMDVAQAIGFSDQGDFTRMFRRVGGFTPKVFRKTVQSSVEQRAR
jgi:AraC-like DNA-binding protein